jgi:hypothetical protein
MNCEYCKYLEKKETKKKIPYGYCEKNKLILIALQEDCKNFKRADK